MASQLPIIRQISLISMVVQISLLLIFSLAFYQIDNRNYLLYSAGCFVLIFFFVRYILPRDHRKGISLYKRHKFKEAIPFFRNSYDFFKKHQWIDKYRFLVLLSSSKISYTEMALLNKAFCLSQSDQKNEAIAEYKKVLIEFPDSEMATSSLKMME
jgi:hypothetical protein